MPIFSNNVISVLERTLLHRETYIAALNGALTHGSKQQFAEQLGITPNYLSNLLSLSSNRNASRELAAKIADLAPLPKEDRSALLHHLLAANPGFSFLNTYNIVELTPGQAWEALRSVADSQFSTYIQQTPEAANLAYRRALHTGNWAMQRIKAYKYPYIFTEMAMHLHNTASALNLPVQAFWYARTSLAVASNPDLWDHNAYRSTRAERVVNSWRMLSVAYHNMGLPSQALRAINHAKDCLADVEPPEARLEWIAHLAMEELNALAIASRVTSISEAEFAASRGMNSIGLGKDSITTRHLLGALIQRNMVEVYINHGSKRSLRLAEQQVYDAFTDQRLHNFNPLAQTLHLRTGANLAHKVGDDTRYLDWIERAYTLSRQAGLTHQQIEIETELRYRTM